MAPPPHLQSGQVSPRALVDGLAVDLEDAGLSILDAGAARGDGAFETIGVWDGQPFRLDDHLDRLAASLARLQLPAPDPDVLRADVAALLRGVSGDGAMRIYVTGSSTRILTLAPQGDRPDPTTLLPLPAPWIQPLATYGPAGAKSMSYGPNMAATRQAQAAGARDALLVAVPDGWVLEGPTFGVLFVVDGVIHAPDVALGIVDSITRRTLLEAAQGLGLEARTGRWPVAALAEAQEVIACSSIRGVVPVARIGEVELPHAHPIADQLDHALWGRRRARSSA